MDILSSQANLAGYKAVVDSFSYYEKLYQWWWHRGTVSATKGLVVGAGVAGLQAIATAKNGRNVFPLMLDWLQRTGWEPWSKFLTVEGSEI